MSDFRTLKGLYIKHVSSDPSNLVAGDIWYNTTTQTLKAAPLLEAWAAGGNLNTGRNGQCAFGNQTDLVACGGFVGTPEPADEDAKSEVEEYNGSAWSEVTDLPTKRSSASASGASQTSGLVVGGIHTNQLTSVEYDGTNWTAGGDVPAVSRMAAQCGTQTATLRCGGAGNPGPALNQTLEYDGSSWTAGENMPHAEYGHMLVGTQTASVFSGGHNAPTEDNLFLYDGTDWSTSPVSLGTKINNNAGSAANGTQTAALWFGGAPAITATQFYDGTSVTSKPALGTGRYSGCSGGTATAAILAGGTSDSDATEEFSGAVTARTWDTS